MTTVTCLGCGWVAFEVTRKHAEAEVERFNAFYATLPPDQQELFYGSQPATLALYEKCMLCDGPHTNVREALPEDCPDGCTLSPLINRKEPRQ